MKQPNGGDSTCCLAGIKWSYKIKGLLYTVNFDKIKIA